jgi:hypothetical protein
MKKQLLTFVGLGLLLATASAYTQSIKFKASVPFNFVVTGETLLGGEYTIRSEKTDPAHELTVNGMGQSPRVFLAVPCLSLNEGRPSNRTKLVFDRYGDQYFLSEIWVKGNWVGEKLLSGRREIERAQNNRLQQRVVIAELRSEGTFDIWRI